MEFLIGEISKENNGDFAHTTPSVSSATATATVQKIERKKYTYQEAENPEEFFLPCVWTCTVRNSPEVPWQLLQTTLIDPLAAGFIRLQDQNPIAVTAVPLASALEDATENSMHASSMTNIQDQV